MLPIMSAFLDKLQSDKLWLFASCTDQRVFNQYLLDINEKLAYVQFELRACRNQYDGNVYYGVVNNVADEQSKLGTKYSAPQVAYYKGIVSFLLYFSNVLVAHGGVSCRHK